MPVATFDDDWCDFCEEENGSQPKCVAACTSGALTLPPDANADNTVLGKAVIIHDWCIAWAGESTCRHCYKACHHLHDAIILKGGKHPEVDRDLCVGCGACQTACISLGHRAVDPNATSRAIIVVAASEAEELAKKVEYMQSDNQPADNTSPEKQSFDDAQRDGRSGNGNHGGQGDKKRGGM
jgi:ferredoxin-type protein NapG